MSESLHKNSQVRVTVTGTASNGNGVGRLPNGMAVFIPMAAEGDTLDVKIIKITKNYAIGKLQRVVLPSPDRIEPDCSVFGRCGGCVFRHITYETECRIKAQWVADAMRRIGKIDCPPKPIVPSPAIDGYRNKAQYPVGTDSAGQRQIGFYAPRSHRIVDCRSCRLQPPTFTQALKAFDQWMDLSGVSVYCSETGQGLLRHIYLRCAPATGQVMACAVVNGQNIPEAQRLVDLLRQHVDGLHSVQINIHTENTNRILGKTCRVLWGTDYITDRLCGLTIRISPLSFYQVNSPQAQRLYELVGRLALGNGDNTAGTLIDLYCGTGTIGLTMARFFERVIGIEIVPQAVEDARENARINGIENAEFLCDDAAGAAQELANRGIRPDVVLLDPPRKGCDAALLNIVATKILPLRIVYVSCDAATLARDAALLTQHGYQTERICPVDMFPRTAHVETVVLMSRNI